MHICIYEQMRAKMSYWIYPGLRKSGDMMGISKKIDEISIVCCNYFNQDIEDVRGKSRCGNLIVPRQISIWIATAKFRMKLKDVGRYFNRDHSTIINSRQKAYDHIRFDREYKRKVSEILELLTIN
jgi:chromosomal replication initiator protein